MTILTHIETEFRARDINLSGPINNANYKLDYREWKS